MGQKNQDKKIKFKYIFSDDYTPKYVKGAVGGISPRGEIVASFYLERPAIPEEIVHELGEGGLLGEVVEKKPHDFENIMIRSIQGGVVLDAEAAKTLHEWLGRQIEKQHKLKSKDKKIEEK